MLLDRNVIGQRSEERRYKEVVTVVAALGE